MKKMFSYICLALCCSLLMTSCINEYFDVEQDSAMVELRIAMPSVQSSPGTTQTKASLEETGNDYENSIVDINDIQIFIFTQDGKIYLGKAFDLELLGQNTATVRMVKGKLPDATLGQAVKLVFMANYGSRDATPVQPDSKQTYNKWNKSLTFLYGDKTWSANDAGATETVKRYIPMSGEAHFTVNNRADRVNYASIDLTRAIAKVRVKVKADCKFSITSLQVWNASSKSYSLQQKKFSVPEIPGQGLYSPLQFNGDIKAGESIEFYIPEQDVPEQNADYRTELKIGMTKDGQTSIETIKFKDYSDKVQETFFPILRNHIYEFVVNKKEDETVDINLSLMDWVIVDVNTEYN